ncbi:MAG: MFS transporter [Pseudonocardiaceae bacterium]|nr:MFS transporter [Pseudonocardiaceae bacterium]
MKRANRPPDPNGAVSQRSDEAHAVTDDADIPPRRTAERARVRGSYRLMFDPVFGPFFWGKVLASAGVWIHNIVAAVVAYQLTGSTLVVGIVTAVQFVPQLLFGPLAGKMADRGDAVRQIVLGRMLTALGSGGLAAWIWLAGGLPGAAPVIVASLVVGLGFVVGGPATQSIVPSLIRPGEMAAAMALNSVPMTLARAAGPALGAATATQLGPGPAFAIAASGNFLFGIIVFAMRIRRDHEHSSDTDFSVRASLRHLRTDPPLALLLLGIAAIGIGADPTLTLTPAIAASLGGGSSVVGWLASAFGIGAGVGFLVFAPLHRLLTLSRLSSGGLLIMAAGLLALAASPSLVLALISFGVSGAGMTVAFTSITTQIQNRSPDALRGRIMALWFVGFLGSRPLAAGLNGFLADVLSIAAALLVTAGITLVAAFLCRPRNLDRPVP